MLIFNNKVFCKTEKEATSLLFKPAIPGKTFDGFYKVLHKGKVIVLSDMQKTPFALVDLRLSYYPMITTVTMGQDKKGKPAPFYMYGLAQSTARKLGIADEWNTAETKRVCEEIAEQIAI